jgi:hypothetical protein
VTPSRALVVALLPFTVLLVAVFVPTGKRHWVTANSYDWFDLHYRALGDDTSMPNQCNGTPACYGGGAYTLPEAALAATVDDLEIACQQYPHVALLFPLVSGPPGSEMVRLDVRWRGLVEAILARGIPCAIQVETRVDVLQLTGKPWQASSIPSDTGRRYNASAQGCPHNTISHWHREAVETSPDVPPEAADNECGWPRVGLCEAGPREDQWCRCYGTDGQLDAGDCLEDLDVDCPESECVIRDSSQFLLSEDDDDVADAMAVYHQIRTNGRQRDAFCDGIPRRGESDCEPEDPSTDNIVPAGKRAWPYIYREYFSFDEGSSGSFPAGDDGFTGWSSPLQASTGSSSTTVKVAAASWTTNEWAGGRAYIRFDGDSANWESREIVSNSSDTLQVTGVCPSTGNPGWCTTPVALAPVGVVSASSEVRVFADISGVLADLENQAARAFLAALPFALAYDLGIPSTHPIVVGLQTKFAYWSIAAPDDATINAPCRTHDDSFQGINWFSRPTPAWGANQCPVTGSHGGGVPLGNPWLGAGQYETLWNDVAKRVLAQIGSSPYEDARLASVSAPSRNVHGRTIGGSGLWEGISPAVHFHPRYTGSRFNAIVPGVSFPFDSP